VMKMLGNIESSFNDIWQIKKNRSYVHRFTNYLSFMLIAPVFVILAGSGSVFVATKLSNIASSVEIVNLSPFVVFLMKLFPYVMTWILFTLLYLVMPNTRVQFVPALIAGILAGTAFQITQWLYIDMQMFMTRTNAIYGSFAALPLLLFVIRISWLIVLFGAEVSFAKQNIDLYEYENESQQISLFAHRAYSILLLEHIIRRFINGEKPLTITEIANGIKLPMRLVRLVVTDLLASGLLLEVNTAKEKVRAYTPARDINQFTFKFVIETLDKNGNSRILSKPSDKLVKILHIQENFLRAVELAPDNILIHELPNFQIEEKK